MPALQTNVMIQQTTPDLPDLPDVVKIADTTEDKLPPMTDIDTLLNEIPIQVNSTPEPLPDLSEIDNLLDNQNSDSSTPELPNLDDLF